MSREPGYEDRPVPGERRAPGDPPPPDARDRYGASGSERPPAPGSYGEPPERRSNGVATAALVSGVAGLILLFTVPPLGVLLGVVAVVLGIVGIAKARRPGTGGTGQAVLGLLTGGLTLLLTALVIWGIVTLFQNEGLQQQLQDQIERLEGAGDAAGAGTPA